MTLASVTGINVRLFGAIRTFPTERPGQRDEMPSFERHWRQACDTLQMSMRELVVVRPRVPCIRREAFGTMAVIPSLNSTE